MTGLTLCIICFIAGAFCAGFVANLWNKLKDKLNTWKAK